MFQKQPKSLLNQIKKISVITRCKSLTLSMIYMMYSSILVNEDKTGARERMCCSVWWHVWWFLDFGQWLAAQKKNLPSVKNRAYICPVTEN